MMITSTILSFSSYNWSFDNWLCAALTLLVIFTFICFLPMIFESPIRDEINRNESEVYLLLLTGTVLVTVPLIIDQVLDVKELWNDPSERQIWISKTIIVFGLCLPSLLQRAFYQSDIYQDITVPLGFAQKGIVLTGLLGIMNRRLYQKQSFSNIHKLVRNYYVGFTLLIIVGFGFSQFFLSLYSFNQGNRNILLASLGFLVVTIVVLLVFVVLQLFLNRPTGFSCEFRSTVDYRDFVISLAILFWVLVILIPTILVSDGRFSLKGVITAITGEDKLLMQFIFTLYLTSVSSRFSAYRAKSGESKLKARLDMLRYCSHEMRNPLNSAFLGLQYHTDHMKRLITLLSEQDIEESKSEIESISSLPSPQKFSKKISVVLSKSHEENTWDKGIPIKIWADEKKGDNTYRLNSMSKDSYGLESPRSLNSENSTINIQNSTNNPQNSVNDCQTPIVSTQSSDIRVQDPIIMTVNKNDANSGVNDENSGVVDENSGLNGNNSFIPFSIASNENTTKSFTEKVDNDEVDIVIYLEGLLENIEEIKGSCNVVLISLNELLMFDKLDEDKISLDRHMEDPWVFVKEASKPFLTNAEQKNVELDIVCKNEEILWFNDFRVNIDTYRLSQVIRNFISNALKFTPTYGTIKILTEIRKNENIQDNSRKFEKNENEENNHYESPFILSLQVIDSGVGISRVNQEKLFGQYVQFNANELQQGKGSGLGLWISKRIVELHQGRIGAYSAGEGSGSTFYFELPLYYNKNQNITMQEEKDLFYSKIINESSNFEEKNEKTKNEESFIHKNMSAFLSFFGQEGFNVSRSGTLSTSHDTCSPRYLKQLNNLNRKNSDIVTPRNSSTTSNLISPRHQPRFDSLIEEEELNENEIVMETEKDNEIDIEKGLKSPTNGLNRFDLKIIIPTKDSENVFLPNLRKSMSDNQLNKKELNILTPEKIENSLKSNSFLSEGDSPLYKEQDYTSTPKNEIKKLRTPRNRVRARSVSVEKPYTSNNETKSWSLGFNILVVDDSGLNRKMLKQLLSSDGQYVEEAKDGKEALSFVKQRLTLTDQWMYDVILMDSNMPIMSGPEATREIRKLNFTGLIFGVTGDTDEAQNDFFIKCGVNSVLQKPINIEMVKNAIEHWKNNEYFKKG